MKIDITKLAKYNLLDYDRELRKFIISFVDRYYPLSQEDLVCVFENKDTVREELAIRKYDETESYKDEDMESQIKKSLEFKKQMIERIKRKNSFKQGRSR